METNKFEDYIAKRLKEREIAPSADSWDQVAEQLGVPKRSNHAPYFRYALVAGFIGAALGSVWFFKADFMTQDPKTVIVDATKDSISIKDKKDTFTLEPEIGGLEVGIVQKPAIVEKAGSPRPKSRRKISRDVEIAQKSDKKTKASKLDHEQETVMEEKIAEVLTQVSLLEADNATLSDREVDSLLRNAQRELLNDKIFKEDRSIDAMALLNEVEGELDQTFRNQIFETLKSGFLKARTALADRNN